MDNCQYCGSPWNKIKNPSNLKRFTCGTLEVGGRSQDCYELEIANLKAKLATKESM